MIEYNPSTSVSLFDRDSHRYDVLPFQTGPLTTAQLFGIAPQVLQFLLDPTGVNINIPINDRQERYYETRFTWKKNAAAYVQNTVTGAQVPWLVYLIAYGNFNGVTWTYDGERPPLVSIGEFDTFSFPRIVRRVSITQIESQYAFDFGSFSDGLNVIPDPAGPHSLFTAFTLQVDVMKKPK